MLKLGRDAVDVLEGHDGSVSWNGDNQLFVRLWTMHTGLIKYGDITSLRSEDGVCFQKTTSCTTLVLVKVTMKLSVLKRIHGNNEIGCRFEKSRSETTAR